MASIQQSLNQTLASTQFAAGLYAHTPMGKKAATLQELKREEKDINKRVEIEGKLLDEHGPESKETQRIFKDYTRHLKGLARIGQERYKIDPSEAAYESMVKRQEDLAEWKTTLKELKDLGGNKDGK